MGEKISIGYAVVTMENHNFIWKLRKWEISKKADYEIIIDTLSLSTSSVALHLKCIVVCIQPLNNKSAPQEKVSVHCHCKSVLITIILPW